MKFTSNNLAAVVTLFGAVGPQLSLADVAAQGSSTKMEPDVGMLTQGSRSLQFGGGGGNGPSLACPQGFVDCDAGFTSDGSTCAAACGGSCCEGTLACEEFTGKVCKDGSCSNNEACAYAQVGEIIRSCSGDTSCSFAYSESLIDSCQSDLSCFQLGAYGGNIGAVSTSCNDKKACFLAGLSGEVASMENACNGEDGCKKMAEDGQQRGGIKNACNNKGACLSLGADIDINVALSDCCNAAQSCNHRGGVPNACLGSNNGGGNGGRGEGGGTGNQGRGQGAGLGRLGTRDLFNFKGFWN